MPLQRYLISGFKYVDVARDGDIQPSEPHGTLTIKRDGTDCYTFLHNGKIVQMRGPEIKRLLYILTGHDMDPSVRLTESHTPPPQPQQPHTREELTRQWVREEIAATLSAPDFQPDDAA